MIKRLGLSFLLLSFNLYGATDCVDCGNHIEGFPSIASLEQASCTDCKCYTETHADTIESLVGERATAAKLKLKENINNSNESLVKKLAAFNKFFQNTKGFDQTDVGSELKGCQLDQVKKSIGDCASAKDGSEHLKQVFGVDSIDKYLGNLAKTFTDEEKSVGNSCLKNLDLSELNSKMLLMSELKAVMPLIVKHKQTILSKLGDQTTLLNFDPGQNEDIIKIKDLLIEISSISETVPVLLNSDAFKKLITDSEMFMANPGKLLSYFENDVYEQFPKTIKLALNNAKELCKEFISGISKVACSGDDIAFVDSAKLFNNFNYFPADHQNGFDTLFADDTGLEIIESNYVSHLYWCASTSCERSEIDLPLCKKVDKAKKLKSKIQEILAEDKLNKTKEESIPSFDPNSLCKLADCQGNQTQMNACYEGVKSELGEDADAILLSYSRVSNSSGQSSTQPGANYTPAQTPFAQQFLGSYSSSPASVATPSQSASAAPVPNDPSVGESSTTGSSSGNGQLSSSSSSNSSSSRVVTANQAFQQFMNQRFDSLGSSASSYPKTQTTPNNAVSTGIRIGSNESMSPSERRALDSMNRASETIEELRESYRSSALDRMQSLVEQAATTSRNRTFDSASVSNSNTASNSTVSRPRTNSSTQNPNVAQTNNVSPQSIPTNTTDQTIGGINSNGQNQTTNGRGVASTQGAAGSTSTSTPRIETNNQGQQTLNVNFTELPTISPAKVRDEGVDTTKNFNIAVRVDREVFLVEVRPTFVAGRRILEPMLDNLSSGLKAEVLKSPLFEDYRQYLLGNLVSN